MTPEKTELNFEEKSRRVLTRAKVLAKRAEQVLQNSAKDLDDARSLLEPSGLVVDSTILDPTFGLNVPILKTTGGHSNTDHVMKISGDLRKDRLNELKRAYQRRMRSMQPETRSEDRWDKPKVPGGRRRRIVRDQDLPDAPPEPPQTGYICFVGQMTTKIRHDRPNEQHQQFKVIQEIGRIWKTTMTDMDREYYNEFSREARVEYEKNIVEYRATGRFDASGNRFAKLQGVGPWVRVTSDDQNGLEREISAYETVQFPMRPKELDEAYRQRLLESVERRKRKLRAEGRRKRSKKEVNTAGEGGGVEDKNSADCSGVHDDSNIASHAEDSNNEESAATISRGAKDGSDCSVDLDESNKSSDDESSFNDESEVHKRVQSGLVVSKSNEANYYKNRSVDNDE